MSVRSLMNKRKVLVDDIMSIILLIDIVFTVLFNQLLAVVSMGVYSLFCLQLYGFYRFFISIFKKKLNSILRVLNFSFGIASIIIPSYILSFMITQPKISASFIIVFLSIPIFLIGLAGLLKGLIVNAYSPLFRFLNVLIGAFTVLFTVIAIVFVETSYVFHLFTLFTTLILNGILRAALYLSEYGLSLNSFRNLKLVWFLMDSPYLPQQEENQINP